MKWPKIIILFGVIHLSAWIGTHFYLANNPREVLLVVDTSHSMKPHFPAMTSWIEDFRGNSRYQKITVGTDKAIIGDIENLKSTSTLFRTAFGRMKTEALRQYDSYDSATKLLLTNEAIGPEGWEVVSF